jgi:hypothetical protein
VGQTPQTGEGGREMTLRNLKTLDEVLEVALIEETLSDGSKVYNITLGANEVPCKSYQTAVEAFTNIVYAIENA